MNGCGVLRNLKPSYKRSPFTPQTVSTLEGNEGIKMTTYNKTTGTPYDTRYHWATSFDTRKEATEHAAYLRTRTDITHSRVTKDTTTGAYNVWVRSRY